MAKKITLQKDALEIASRLIKTEIPFDVVRRKNYFILATDKFVMTFDVGGEMKEIEQLKYRRNIGAQLEGY